MKHLHSLINTKHISTYTADEYTEHLRSIRRYTAKVVRDGKVAAKARIAEHKPAPKSWSFRITPKGKGSITLRGRKPPYITPQEHQDMLVLYPDAHELINAAIAARSITIKESTP